ncbi:MAG: hypothetical protein PUC15_07040 [Lentisphaeria bacterium]|nr:hypothetical protein [Lentisphaeria bacterium]
MKKLLVILLCFIILVVIVFALAVHFRGGCPFVKAINTCSLRDASDKPGPDAAAKTVAGTPGEDPDNAPIVKLQLFKNGFGFVTREIAPRDWATPLVLNPAIAPRHGTLWFDPAETIVRRTTRERTVVVSEAAKKDDAPGYQPNWSNLTDAFAWQKVTVKTKDGLKHTGTVIGNRPPQEQNAEEPQTYEIIDTLSAYRSSSSSRVYRPDISSSAAPFKSPFGQVFLTLKTDEGYLTIRQDDVAAIRAEQFADDKGANPADAKKTKQTEVVQVVEAPKNHIGPVRMRYLSEGITWSPFYRIDLHDDDKLTVYASATVLNTLEPFEDAEVEFISGFPNMVFASTISAIAKGTTFRSFLNSLENAGSPRSRGVTGQGGVMSQSVMTNYRSDDFDYVDAAGNQPSLWSTSGMDDIQYYSAGKLSMGKEDVLQLPIASKTADFEYVTTWTAPLEPRYTYEGVRISSSARASDQETTPWNCIRFRNPFDFALTTAPYEIEHNGQVLGQSTGSWFGSGDLATVQITKSMSVSASIYQGESGNLDREVTLLRYNEKYRYRKPDVTATITLTNRGPKPVKMLVDATYYGELVSAEGDPTRTPILSSVDSINPKNKLAWEVTVPAAGQIKLNYTYAIILER